MMSISNPTPPSSPPTAVPIPISSSSSHRPRRLRHSKSPIHHISPDNNIPRTSLYQYSDPSLAAIYASPSPAGLSKNFPGAGYSPETIFTAVIPPLAGVPPTAPLPPTPPMQMGWEKLGLNKEDLNATLEANTHNIQKRKSPKSDIMVVGIVQDTREQKENSGKKKHVLRHMKGNVAEVKHSTSTQTTPEKIKTTNMDVSSGLPTPSPSPPASAKRSVPPRPLHHPKPVDLPRVKLDFVAPRTNDESHSKSNCSSKRSSLVAVSEDENGDEDDDGGIRIDYQDDSDHGQDHAYNTASGNREREVLLSRITGLGNRDNTSFGIDIPRPDSPFVTGSEFGRELEQNKEYQELHKNSNEDRLSIIEKRPRAGNMAAIMVAAHSHDLETPISPQWGHESEDEGVRLSATKHSFPSVFNPPTRIDIDKAEVVGHHEEEEGVGSAVDSSPATVLVNENGHIRGEITQTSEVKVESTVAASIINSSASKECNDEKGEAGKLQTEEEVGNETSSIKTSSPVKTKNTVISDADRFISRSSIAKRRQIHPSLDNDIHDQSNNSQFLPTKPLQAPKDTPQPSNDENEKEKMDTFDGMASAVSDPPSPAPKTTTRHRPPPASRSASLASALVVVGETTIRPPSLPKFNFIPPTPLPLISPSSILEKQLGDTISLIGTATPAPGTITGEGGEDANPTTNTSTTAARRPPLHPKRLRESKLHPWWRPRVYYLQEEALARAFEFDPDNYYQSRFSEMNDENEDARSDIGIVGTPGTVPNPGLQRRSSWSGFGPVRVDKKRKVVGVGGVQIEWVGLGGWYERIMGSGKGEGKNEAGKGKGKEKEKEEKGKGKEKVKEDKGKGKSKEGTGNSTTEIPKKQNLKRKSWMVL